MPTQTLDYAGPELVRRTLPFRSMPWNGFYFVIGLIGGLYGIWLPLSWLCSGRRLDGGGMIFMLLSGIPVGVITLGIARTFRTSWKVSGLCGLAGLFGSGVGFVLLVGWGTLDKLIN